MIQKNSVLKWQKIIGKNALLYPDETSYIKARASTHLASANKTKPKRQNICI